MDADARPETDLQRFVAGFNVEQVYHLGQHLAFCERHDDATEPPEDTSGSAEHLHEDTVFSAHNFASDRWHWNRRRGVGSLKTARERACHT